MAHHDVVMALIATRGVWIDDATRTAADVAAEQVALEAVRTLGAMDAWKAAPGKRYYVPPLHLKKRIRQTSL